VLTRNQDSPLYPRALDDLVHAVDATKKCGLPAARRPDNRRNLPGRERERDVAHPRAASVPCSQTFNLYGRCKIIGRARVGAHQRFRQAGQLLYRHRPRRCNSSRAETLKTSTIITSMNEPAHACSCWYLNGPVAYVKIRNG